MSDFKAKIRFQLGLRPRPLWGNFGERERNKNSPSDRSGYGPDMSSSVRLSSVCRLSSVTFVHPTQANEIFGNVSTPFGTLAICDLSI